MGYNIIETYKKTEATKNNLELQYNRDLEKFIMHEKRVPNDKYPQVFLLIVLHHTF